MKTLDQWQHIFAILAWQALMLAALIAGASLLKSDEAESVPAAVPEIVSSNTDQPVPKKPDSKRAKRLLDFGLRI